MHTIVAAGIKTEVDVTAAKFHGIRLIRGDIMPQNCGMINRLKMTAFKYATLFPDLEHVVPDLNVVHPDAVDGPAGENQKVQLLNEERLEQVAFLIKFQEPDHPAIFVGSETRHPVENVAFDFQIVGDKGEYVLFRIEVICLLAAEFHHSEQCGDLLAGSYPGFEIGAYPACDGVLVKFGAVIIEIAQV